MFLYLVHHGDAVDSEVDPQRPLSARGRAGAERLAVEAARRGARPAFVWHSGKLRARQTAEPFWRGCNPLAAFEAVRGLQPDDPPAIVRDLLAGETRDVMLVGHMPHLLKLLRALVGETAEFPQHGVVALERTDDTYVERWRIDEGSP